LFPTKLIFEIAELGAWVMYLYHQCFLTKARVKRLVTWSSSVRSSVRSGQFAFVCAWFHAQKKMNWRIGTINWATYWVALNRLGNGPRYSRIVFTRSDWIRTLRAPKYSHMAKCDSETKSLTTWTRLIQHRLRNSLLRWNQHKILILMVDSKKHKIEMKNMPFAEKLWKFWVGPGYNRSYRNITVKQLPHIGSWE